MIAGFDRYFQIVRCFRDEDFRADRQAEFTQIDVEMSFPQRDALFEVIERLAEKLFALVDVKISLPFSKLGYETAMEKYGSDKPHLGFGLEWKRVNLPEEAREKLQAAQSVKLLRIPGQGSMSRAQLDKLQEMAKANGAERFSYLKVEEGKIQSPLTKPFGGETVRSLAEAAGAQVGDLVLFLGLKSTGAALSRAALHRLDEVSGLLRLELARRLDLIKPGTWSFAWIIDFPMFEYDENAKRFGAMHHPFTSPREEDLEKLETNPGEVKALAYDLVLNGSEIGGGSIRMHRRDIQARVFKVLGLSDEKARERFGFFMDALEYGAPPHGGIALGWDRIIALMAGETSIREVIAFPKTASATDLMCDAPAPVDPDQLDELGLKIK